MTPSEFETEVRTLLKLQGWQITTEHLLAGKKVDAYAEKRGDFGKIRRIALECKHYASKLTREEVVQIYADYHPLSHKDHIDGLLLVTTNGLTPSASAYVLEAKSFEHITYADLLNSLIDLAGYVRQLLDDWDTDPVKHYYIPQNISGCRVPIEEEIDRWLEGPDSKPIAVLGGYGIGKTTLARRLASTAAQKHHSDPNSRVPILIRLQDLVSESSLEGLLGKHFTTAGNTQSYSFPLFTALNARGRYVIILDGFDEMRRLMSWETLRFNLSQLNRLIVPSAKVILLGRPNAFMTEDEQIEALHGLRDIGGLQKRIPDWPDYTELYIGSFTPQQVEDFIDKFLTFLASAPSGHTSASRLRNTTLTVGDRTRSRLAHLGSRPVHLKMLMDILPTYDGNIDAMTVAILYSEFIDLIIRRESDKLARQAFTMAERRQFASSLAYWMWCEHLSHITDAHRLPDVLFLGFLKKDAEIGDVKRDLLASCFLERKPRAGLFFPHRSVQEFLVAEHLVELVHSEDDVNIDCPELSGEITSFFLELLTCEGATEWRAREEGKRSRITQWRGLLALTCNHYGLPQLDWMAHTRLPAAKNLRRFLVADILSHPSPAGEFDATKEERRKHTRRHRQAGVIRKSQYRSRH